MYTLSEFVGLTTFYNKTCVEKWLMGACGVRFRLLHMQSQQLELCVSGCLDQHRGVRPQPLDIFL